MLFYLLVWCPRSSFKNSKRCQQLKTHPNPPLSPFFQRGNFLCRTFTPLWKRGEGEIFKRMSRELCGVFLRQYTGFVRVLARECAVRCHFLFQLRSQAGEAH